MPTPADIQTAITAILADTAKLHDVVHGGPAATVATEGGVVPSVAKAISDISAAIIVGFATGFVNTATNAGNRATVVPAKVGQLLIQLDSKELYVSNGLLAGNWVYLPIQTAAADAAAAVAAVTVLTAAIADLLDYDTYVDPAGFGTVRSAHTLADIEALIAADPDSSLHFVGVQNSGIKMIPALNHNLATGVVDGQFRADGTTYRLSPLYNTSRRCQGLGSNFVFFGTPNRLASWGAQGKFGTLASGVNGASGFFPRTTIAVQQPDRNLPGFDPNALYTAAGQIVEVSSQGAVTMALTADGIVLVAGGIGQGVKAMFGTGVDKTQTTFMPLYFNSGGNRPIRLFDVQDSTDPTYLGSTAVFVDDAENVWVLTTNKNGANYGVGAAGAVNIPLKLNPGFGTWSTMLVKKVRCDITGGVFILFTGGELWGGGGSNATGYLGTGSTANVLTLLQLRTGVSDFEISGQERGTVLTLWTLEGNVLKGAGYNINGQLGQVAGPTANKTSFVTVANDVDIIRLGGTDTVTLMYRNASTSTWYGLGRNSSGVFGEGVSATTNNVPVALAALTLLIQDHGYQNLVISGYNLKQAACLVTLDGKAYCAGYNAEGTLGIGSNDNVDDWTEVLWSPRDSQEKIIDVSACVTPGSGPGFTWVTNQGRVLMAGPMANGFATGINAPGSASTSTQLIAQPVQLGTL